MNRKKYKKSLKQFKQKQRKFHEKNKDKKETWQNKFCKFMDETLGLGCGGY